MPNELTPEREAEIRAWLQKREGDTFAEGALALRDVDCANDLLRELDRLRTAPKARDESAVARFLAHPAAQMVASWKHSDGTTSWYARWWVDPGQSVELRVMSDFVATPEDACAAALRALEPERGGE